MANPQIPTPVSEGVNQTPANLRQGAPKPENTDSVRGNLGRFAPGVSGNPGGRPRKRFTQALSRVISDADLEQIAAKVREMALAGSHHHLAFLADRLEGRAAMASEDREVIAAANGAGVDPLLGLYGITH